MSSSFSGGLPWSYGVRPPRVCGFAVFVLWALSGPGGRRGDLFGRGFSRHRVRENARPCTVVCGTLEGCVRYTVSLASSRSSNNVRSWPCSGRRLRARGLVAPSPRSQLRSRPPSVSGGGDDACKATPTVLAEVLASTRDAQPAAARLEDFEPADPRLVVHWAVGSQRLRVDPGLVEIRRDCWPTFSSSPSWTTTSSRSLASA